MQNNGNNIASVAELKHAIRGIWEPSCKLHQITL